MPNVSPDQFWAFCAIALAILGALALILQIVQHFKQQPPLHKQFVDRETYDRDRAEFKQELSRNAAARKTNYEKLESLGREQSRMSAENTSQSERITVMDTKIDRILERLPRKS